MSDWLKTIIPDEDPRTQAGMGTTAKHMQDNTSWLKRIAPDYLDAPAKVAAAPATDYRQEQKAKWYSDLMELTEAQNIPDPKAKEQEIAKIQVSMYLASRMGVEPRDVYMSWDGNNNSPIAAEYFKQIDLPVSYRKRMANEVKREWIRWKAQNKVTDLMYEKFDPAKYQEVLDLLDTMPPTDEPEGRPLGKGGTVDWFADVPIEAIRLGATMLDTSLGGLVVGGLGAAIGGIAAGPPGAAAGFRWGRRVGATLETTRTEAASIWLDLMTTPDPQTGEPLGKVVKDPQQLSSMAALSASIGGGVIGALNMIGYETMIGQGAKLAKDFGITFGKDLIKKAGSSGLFRNTLSQFLLKYGRNLAVEVPSEVLETVIEQISQDAAKSKYNRRMGTDIPLATAKQYKDIMLQTADSVLKGTALLGIPGAAIEAKASLRQMLEAESKEKAVKRLSEIERITNTARPIAERITDIGARLDQLQKEQEQLRPTVQAIDPTKPMDKGAKATADAYASNAAEIEYLDWQRREAEAAVPGQPWQTLPIPEPAAQAPVLAPTAEQAMEEAAPIVSEAQLAHQEQARQFMGLTPEQITPEVARQLREFYYTNRQGQQIQTAEQMYAQPNLLLTGGVAGGGKSGVIDMAGFVRENRVDVNADNFKDLTGLTESEWHENAARIAGDLLTDAIERGHHVTYDSQMTNYPKAERLIESTLAKGGPVAIAFTHIDADTSRARQVARQEEDKRLGKKPRPVPISVTVKGWNESLPTFIELYKKYKDDPRVRFNLQDNNTDFVKPKTIIRNNVVLDQKALDALLATEYVSRGEGNEKRYTRTEATALSDRDLEAKEQLNGSRGLAIADRLRERRALESSGQGVRGVLPAAPGGAGEGPPGDFRPAAEGPLASPDLAPTSLAVSLIREGLPNLTVSQAQGTALYVKLLAAHEKMGLEEYLRAHFVKGVFDPTRTAWIESLGKKGAISWTKAGKAIFWTTTKSDVSTAIHEFTHEFELHLTASERTVVETWLGVKPGNPLTEKQKERFADTGLAYILKGKLPNEELRPVFDRLARWVNEIYETARVEWDISPEIIAMYDKALANTPFAPKATIPDDTEILFQTDPEAAKARIDNPADLTVEVLLKQTEFQRNLFAPYAEGASSRTTPNPMPNLVEGTWMVDDKFRGIHGHEIAQLQKIDPAKVRMVDETAAPGEYQMTEDLVKYNIEGRTWDAERYAEWMRQGMTPPPIIVLETQDGSYRISNGHRRAYAAKLTGTPIYAWVWPAAEHPEGLRIDGGTGPVMRVGLTYEMATGRNYEADVLAATEREMLFQSDPEAKQDQWILKSRAVILDKMRGPAPAENVRNILVAAGVKEEELIWTGLDDFLKGDKKLTPREVLDFIEANQVVLKEVLYAEAPEEIVQQKIDQIREREIQQAAERYEEEMQENTPIPDIRIELAKDEEGNAVFDVVVNGEAQDSYNTMDEAAKEVTDLEDEFGDSIAAAARDRAETEIYQREIRRPHVLEAEARELLKDQQPKYENYKLPGGEGYRELLITLPPALDREAEARRIIGESIWGRMGQTDRDRMIASATNPALRGTFKSAHWDEPNILVHVRFNERTDIDGKRVLFIEEIQSDWHNKARAIRRAEIKRLMKEEKLSKAEATARVTSNYGYALPPLTRADIELKRWGEGDTAYWEATDKRTGAMIARESGSLPEDQVIASAIALGPRKDVVPNAPFKKTWDELAFKRMIRWAAENDFERIEWTTGQQQADRYSLEKFISKVIYRPATNHLLAWAPNRGREGDPASQVIDETVQPEELADYIGKEAAVKLLSQPLQKDMLGQDMQELSGENLKVGGEGKKAIYDKMLVDTARKLGKKFGAEVGTTTIEAASADDEAYRVALQQVMDSDSDSGDLAGMVLGYMEDNEFGYAESIESAKDAGIATDEEIRNLEKETAIQMVLKGEREGYQVHSLELPAAMRESVLREGQMLFQPTPHEEAVRQAVEKRQPVPDKVLEYYKGNEWADAEIKEREDLIRKARTVSSFPEFYDWQTRSHPDLFPSELYYRQIWDKAQATSEGDLSIAERFTMAMDDEAVRFTVGGMVFSQADNPDGMKGMTPEMRALGTKIVAGEEDPVLAAKVREQIAADPLKWKQFFKDYLPSDVQEELKTILDASDSLDFTPVIPKVANERFTDSLNTPRKMKAFLLTMANTNALKGVNRYLHDLGKRIQQNPDDDLSQVFASKALAEVRKNITLYREAYAIATQDQEMLAQLNWEEERATESEEARLLKENARLRAEIKTAIEAQRATSLREAWTLSDLNKEIKGHQADVAKWKADIAQAKAKIKESVEQAKKEAKSKAEVWHMVDRTLWKKRLVELQKRNEADVAVLKARIKQVKESARQSIEAERAKREIEKFAEYINRPINAGIADFEARMIEDIQSRIKFDPEDVTEGTKNRLREWRRQNPDAPMPPDLVQQIEARNPRLITRAEMEKLYLQVKSLRQAGRARRMSEMLQERILVAANTKAVEDSIRGGREPKDITGLGTKGARRKTKTSFFKQALWATWRMNRIADMLDGGKPGPATEWLWNKINEATDQTIRTVDAYATENLSKLGDLGLGARDFGRQERIGGETLTRGQMIGVYVYSQFEDGAFSLVEDNHLQESTIKAIVSALKPEEKAYGDWMIEKLSSDQDFDRLQQVQLAVSNTRMDRLPRYFPMQRQGPSGNPLLSDLARELLEMAGKTNKPRPRSGFLKSRMERTEGISFPPLRLDAPAIYMDHIQKREFYVANAQLIKRMTRIFDSREVKAAMADRYGDAMQPLVQRYVAQYTNPNIYRAFEDYGEFTRLLRGNVGLSLIGSNALTILKQLPDIPQIMIMAGPIDGMRAAAQFLANPRKAIQTVWEKAPQLKQRSYDRVIEELKTLDRNAYERIIKGVGEAGFLALKAMDTVTNTIGWIAIYNKTLRRTGNDNLATRAARDFILAKRPAARAKDLAAIYRSPGAMSWFLMFTNQINQQWNILSYDIPTKLMSGLRGNQADLIDAFLNVTALAVGAVCMGMVVRKREPTWKEAGGDLLVMLLGNTPFIGNSIEAAIRGQNEPTPINPMGGAYEAAKTMVDVARGADSVKVMRDLQNFLFTASGTLGLPVVQAKRFYRTIGSGDPWDLIGGPPKKKED